MGGTLYTELCPACGEEYTVEYRAEKDEFIKITKCKCDKLADVIQDVLGEISRFKTDYELEPQRFKKRNIIEVLNAIQTKLETAL